MKTALFLLLTSLALSSAANHNAFHHRDAQYWDACYVRVGHASRQPNVCFPRGTTMGDLYDRYCKGRVNQAIPVMLNNAKGVFDSIVKDVATRMRMDYGPCL